MYLRDFFVYGSDQALDKLIQRLLYQRTKLDAKDLQIILQSVLEEINTNESVKSYLNTQLVIKTLEKMLKPSNMTEGA